MRARLVALVALLLALPAAAHEFRPGYLEVRELGPERFAATFRVPARGELRLALQARLPAECDDLGPRAGRAERGAFTQRWTFACAGGLVGREIRIDGLSATLTEVLARVERADGSAQVARLVPAAPAFAVAAAPRALEVARTYLALGIEHILFGVDHLLFVLALVIVVGAGTRRLVGTITSFTAAHSLTLAAATLGYARLPQPPIEAVIALSIVFVASEILRARAGRPGLSARAPWLVAFSFGLLHGFGFAGALREVGLPEQALALALLFFNLGVELGQLAFVALLGLGVLAARRLTLPEPSWASPLSAYAIGTSASFWLIERVAGFWR